MLIYLFLLDSNRICFIVITETIYYCVLGGSKLAKSKATANQGDFDDPRGLYSRSSEVRFSSPINMNEIVFAARREPVGKRVVVDVAFDVMAKGFKVEEEAEKPNPEWTRQVSLALDELDTKAKLRELVLFERLYGWATLGLSYVDYGDDPGKPVQDPKRIVSLTVFSDHNCSVQSSDVEKDAESERAGLPNLYTVKIGSQQKKINWTRMIHYASRLMGHPWRGVPVLEVLYSDLTAYRNAREAIVHSIKTHAAGFADITLKGKKSQRQLDNFDKNNDLTNLDSRSKFVHGSDSKVDWIGAKSKALDPEPYANISLESLSCGSRIPVSHLRGATAGTLAGSEVNDREYWGGIGMQQSLLERVVWDLIDRLMDVGRIDRVVDYNLVWPSGFELSDQTVSEIALRDAQTRKLKLEWMTVDEVRDEQGLDPLPEGAGKVVLGLLRLSRQPEQQQDAGLLKKLGSFLRGKKEDE